MPAPQPLSSSSPSGPSRWPVYVAALLLAAAVALAYANSLSAPFVYDDRPSIAFNPTIRELGDWQALLHPPGAGATVSGRPVLNISFALNYAIHGLDVRGYHLTNIAIHLAAALALFGLTRRTLRRPAFDGLLRHAALPVAFAVAACWALHPLQTESVTYLVQRAESLMALFFLLTVYAFARSVDSARPPGWQAAAVTFCALGMATKENMAAAPLIVLLYDRTFVAGGFASAWRARRKFYVALGCTWILLGALVLSTGGDRGGSVGFGVGIGIVPYWLTQFPALARYAALTFWPQPLVFDYGAFTVSGFAAIALPALLVAGLLLGTAWALVRSPVAGFLGAVVITILAPTSIVPGTTQMIVEHRMYLPIAAVFAGLVPWLWRAQRRVAILALALMIPALGLATAARNYAYRSELALWTDTTVKRPDNVVARSSLGAALKNAGRSEQALAEYRTALRLNPDYVPALTNLGIALAESGRPEEGLPYATRAIEIDPHHAQAHLNLGVILDLLHRSAEALPRYAEALRLVPLLPEAQNDYGDALSRAGRIDEGIQHLQRAIELQPDYAEAYFNLAGAIVRQGHLADAQAIFARGASLRPTDGSVHTTWANFLLRQNHLREALAEYEQALALTPDAPDAHYSYGTALARTGQYDAARQQFEAAIRLRPNYAEAHNNLANTLFALNRLDEAVAEYDATVRLRPKDAPSHNNLGLALARIGRLKEAAAHFETAVQLAPDFENARQNLARAHAQLGP